MGVSERRSQIRLALPEWVVHGPEGLSGRVRDVSSAGLGILIEAGHPLARGEHHRLALSDRLHSVEIEGTVRWTQSDWHRSKDSGKARFSQAGGLRLWKLLAETPVGAWSSLMTRVPRVQSAVAPTPTPATNESASRPGPHPHTTGTGATDEALAISRPLPRHPVRPLEMLEPAGDRPVKENTVNVVCLLHEPEAVTHIRINRVDALMMNDLATAAVKLDPGINRIVAAIRRRDGSYSTYLLGKIERSG